MNIPKFNGKGLFTMSWRDQRLSNKYTWGREFVTANFASFIKTLPSADRKLSTVSLDLVAMCRFKFEVMQDAKLN